MIFMFLWYLLMDLCIFCGLKIRQDSFRLWMNASEFKFTAIQSKGDASPLISSPPAPWYIETFGLLITWSKMRWPARVTGLSPTLESLLLQRWSTGTAVCQYISLLGDPHMQLNSLRCVMPISSPSAWDDFNTLLIQLKKPVTFGVHLSPPQLGFQKEWWCAQVKGEGAVWGISVVIETRRIGVLGDGLQD